MKDIIERRMRELGIANIRDVERAAGVKKDVIGNMLRGRSQSVRSENIVGIARAIRVPISVLLTGESEKKTPSKWQALDICKSTDNLDFPNSENQIGFATKIGSYAPNSESDFLLEVEDDMMAPTLLPGDLVLVHKGEKKSHSKIGLIKTKGGGFHIRRLTKRVSDGKLDIRTDNPDYPDELGINASSITIYGSIEVIIKRV